jgi:hypothetical protein
MEEKGKQTPEHWEPMELKYVGDVGEVLKLGGGKVSTDVPEPGEGPTKPPGQ